jgi:hypothetical protein
MKRIDLIPTKTRNGRHLMLEAVPVSRLEQLRRLARRLVARPAHG